MQIRLSGLALCTASLFFVGCGKKGPLLYPDLLVAQPPSQVQVEQVDMALRITFVLPEKDQAGRPLNNLESVRIARRVCVEADCKGCLEPYQELQRIDVAFPDPAEREGSRIRWTDAGVRPGEVVQYRLVSEQKGGITGGAAQTLPARLAVAVQPPVCTGKAVFGGTLQLNCRTADSGTTGQLLGYLLYRAEGTGPTVFLTRLGPDSGGYVDQAVVRGIAYRYAAKQQIRREDGSIQESAFSAPVVLSLAEE